MEKSHGDVKHDFVDAEMSHPFWSSQYTFRHHQKKVLFSCVRHDSWYRKWKTWVMKWWNHQISHFKLISRFTFSLSHPQESRFNFPIEKLKLFCYFLFPSLFLWIFLSFFNRSVALQIFDEIRIGFLSLSLSSSSKKNNKNIKILFLFIPHVFCLFCLVLNYTF